MLKLTVNTRGVKNPALRMLFLIAALFITLVVIGGAIALLLTLVGVAVGMATVTLGLAGILAVAAIPIVLVRTLFFGRKNPTSSTGLLHRVVRRRLPPTSH